MSARASAETLRSSPRTGRRALQSIASLWRVRDETEGSSNLLANEVRVSPGCHKKAKLFSFCKRSIELIFSELSEFAKSS